MYQPSRETQPSNSTGSAPRRFTLLFSLPALLIACALLAGTAQAPVANAVATASTQDLTPTERQRRVSKLVSNVIERSHYRQSPINDPVSALVLDRYIEQLDGGRSYFLASDIAEFERYRYQLDDAVVSGKLEPVFAIFNRFQVRNRERINYALELLKTEPNFTVDEYFEFDREKAPWAKSQVELNEIWRQRVKNDALSLMLTEKPWAESRDVLQKRYERVLKRTEQVTSDDIFEVFMNAFAHVFDPHSSYFSPRNSEEYRIQMSLSYEGIGASLQLVDDYVTVLNVLPGGAAAASGQINVNDRIVAVGEGKSGKPTDVVGWRLDDVVQLIRGKINTVVHLQILPAGATPGSPMKDIFLTRNKVTLEAQASKKEIRKVKRDDRELTVGVINVPSFYQDFEAKSAGEKDYRSTTRDVRKLIEELKTEHMDALVMDLRGNGGGHLTEATALSGLFIPGGPIVQLRETGGRVEVLDDPEPSIAWDGPMIVLVDRFSASASEIFAAAIQDYGRGVVVGQQTYGKGSVQNLYPLDRYALGPEPGFGQLTVTIGKYYRVTGESTQHRGVQPDISMPTAISPEEVGESTRESALPWDRIRPVEFGREGPLTQAIATLEQSHQRRIAQDADFVSLLGDLDSFEKVRTQKKVSLNLQKRIEERETLEKERLARENTRRAAHGQAPLAKLSDLNSNEAPDPTLAEAAQIAADMNGIGSLYLSKLKTENSASPATP
ncbi:carboxyl-terminal processing protease [Povalibacter uvarum]|uniref:Carboxyl-terminal processing protease n=1 Tax=Povalibacter uvarum TaxID=732238 RepID=A0A841HGS5_9GAMM|nr:carboxy terminal-processing peptidase [Povalibacter uvarum]MBB6092331.1 carboxyl-terminal processing protease [Povalibacter uvarum]